ncbi:MAG: hypothetical protein PW844_19030 [Pantoea sp.]|uniref:hypothetical protein n=1 Tax=Pantoea sp. TaxID=69393 RepID=UPI002393F958|nr:hypothetical protein [Pantoea sp.]MDE1188543.1 hypothetical protein [Pantoea sp.]
MRKIAMYRRNNHPNSGFKEKLAYQLSKGPKTGSELCIIFNMSLRDFNSNIRDVISKHGETLQVNATDPVKVGRFIDKTYSLARRPKRVNPKKGSPLIVSWKQLANTGEEKRLECEAAAKRRARLIKAGFNPGCLE